MMKHSTFQDLVAKVKNLVTLAPVLGAISRPEMSLFFFFNLFYFCFQVTLRNLIFNIAQELGNSILRRIDKVTVPPFSSA